MGTPVKPLVVALIFVAAAGLGFGQQAMGQTVSPDAPRNEGHGGGYENGAMLRVAHDRPDRFIGKMLILSTGKEAGQVLAVRRRKEDKSLYLVIQAKPYFNRSIEFAVPVVDVSKIVGATVVLSKLPGDFLRGIEYDASEFEGIGDFSDAPLVVDD